MRIAPIVTFALWSQGCQQVTSALVATDGGALPGWTILAAGTTNLNGVSGVSDDAVWVVGDRGTIAHWDGTHLAFESSGTTVNLRGVFALDTDQAFAVGDQGTILARKAGQWQPVAAGVTLQVLTGVWADTKRVVAVGSNGTVVVGTTTGYTLATNSGNENLLAVTGIPGGAATAVGALGLVLQISGTTLSRQPITAFSKLLSGAATGTTTSYYVGQQGTVYRSGPSGINSLTGCPQSALRAVSTLGDDAWVVGWDGAMCRISGATVTSFPYKDARWFNGVYAASPTSVWVVGATGTLLHGLPVPPLPDAGTKDGGGGDAGP